MRLRLATTLLISIVLLAPTVAIAAPSWQERWETARFKTLTHPQDELSVKEAMLTLKSVARIKKFSFSRADCIAKRESGYNENAYNSYSGASGIFQHLRRYWPGRAATYTSTTGPLAVNPNPSPFNGRANIIVSGSMMGRGMWSHWSSTDNPC